MTSNYGDGVHVVFGATGAYGYAVTRKLAEKNLHVRAVVRDEKKLVSYSRKTSKL